MRERRDDDAGKMCGDPATSVDPLWPITQSIQHDNMATMRLDVLLHSSIYTHSRLCRVNFGASAFGAQALGWQASGKANHTTLKGWRNEVRLLRTCRTSSGSEVGL